MGMFPLVSLADCADLLAGYAFKSQHFTNNPNDIALVKGENISQGHILWDISKRWSTADWATLKKFQLHTGDVVVAMDRPWVPAGLKWASIREGDPKALLVQRCARLRSRSANLDQNFLRFVIGGPRFESYIRPITTGVNVPHISAAQILGFQFALPPLPAQRRIASILSAYDELIENGQRRIRILEDMARALYREWFVHFRFPGHEAAPLVPSPLGEIPQGWEVKTIDEITSYINRGIAPIYDEDGESSVINQRCIRDQQINLAPARRQSRTIPADKQVRFGDVLINSTGVGTLGRVAQVYESLKSYSVDTHVTIVRAGASINMDFFGSCLLYLQDTFERLGVGATGQTELSRAAIAAIELAVPQRDLQDRFGTAVQDMKVSAQTLGHQIQILRQTRDLLLPRLLSGHIDVSSPELPL